MTEDPSSADDADGKPVVVAPSVAELQDAAVEGSAWTSLQASVLLPVSILVNIIVARSLGPTEFGYTATLAVAFGLATAVANMGVSDATIQWGAAAHAGGRRQELVMLIRRCAGYHILIEAPLIMAVTAVLLRHANWETQLVTSLAAGGAMAIGTASVAQTLLSRTATVARAALVVSLSTQVAVVVVATSTGSGFSTWAARIVVTSTIPFILFVRLPADLRRAVCRPALPRRWPPGFVAYSGKAGVGALAAALVFSRSEILVLQAKDLAVAAGVFALAYGLSVQMTAPIDALLGPLVPAAASLVASAPEKLGAALLRGFRFTALGSGLIAAVGIPAVSVLVPYIYGEGYATVAVLILPLAIVSCVQSLNHPATAFMYAMRRVGTMLAINIVAFGLDIGIAIAVIGSLGVWGAVLANAVGQFVALMLALAILRRELSLPVRVLAHSMRAFAGGAIAATVAFVLVRAVPESVSPLAASALGLVAGAVLFVAFLAPGSPVLTLADADLLASAIPRRFRNATLRTLAALRMAPSRAAA